MTDAFGLEPRGAGGAFTNARERGPLDDLELLVELLEEGVAIDGQVVQISETTWAVHGNDSYGGEIIVAEFESTDQARAVLRRLPPTSM